MRALLVLLLLFHLPAHAGRSCELREPEPRELEVSLGLAAGVEQLLERSGQRVALVARVGQDLSKYGLHYSHAAFVWRDHPAGRWTAVHLLNACGTQRSALYDEGLGAFFLDIHRPEAAILFPAEEAQQQLETVLRSDLAHQLHEPRYNMLAFAFSQKYQNSNQWLLEVYAAAMARDTAIGTREAAQYWLRAAGYQPETVELGTLTRLGGRMFRANVAFDDHPFGRRMAGHIDTVTVDSVFRFVRKRDRGAGIVEVGSAKAARIQADPGGE